MATAAEEYARIMQRREIERIAAEALNERLKQDVAALVGLTLSQRQFAALLDGHGSC